MLPKLPAIDTQYLTRRLLDMLAIPSPTGFTDSIVYYVGRCLEELGVGYTLSRRGTLCATLPGEVKGPKRALVTHLDTIGAMVREIKPNGRLAITPIGHWSSRFAEGGRVTLFGERIQYRGTVLPLMAAGHAFNEAIDTQPVNWDQVEVRLDVAVQSADDVRAAGLEVGDFVAFDAHPEITETGFIISRHLDNKAGAASLLATLEAMQRHQLRPRLTTEILFTLSEEVGSGAGHALDDDVTEFVGIDIGPVASGQNARETGVTVAMKDSSGPFDYHLSHHLIDLCRRHDIPWQRDVFRFYYSDAVSAVQAGHDIRPALITFGTDATHGYERTHLHALESCARLMSAYLLSDLAWKADRKQDVPLQEFAAKITEQEPQAMPRELPEAVILTPTK
ncbi:osmoprotectant NAGGN system M42 family peptidase [Pokkaliibacter plantistimulans]|uniref:Osmoprotectant NAGGN system M42 family peptidase n=1 Tax=Proteobacteria bacterium 228 TaxID=2083153 RepID=A0A2S5KU12_9PROT|nr:osmoprotectant NAGGN system M42 family peptidase [Pokkaliibacter plantistimulans]PPC78203.1 osmoprotectant NAGGN system M42 family peptidase [Pokkaliibacter plantistimulans]